MTTVQTDTVTFKVDTRPFEIGMVKAPAATYYWLRSNMELNFALHRKRWLQDKRVRFSRGKYGVKVPGLNKSRGGEREVTYRVEPEAERDSAAPIDAIRGDAFTPSTPLAGLQFGGTVRPETHKFLAIPINPPNARRKNRRAPRAFARSLPKKSRLIYRETKSGARILAERIRERKGERRRAATTKTGRVRKSQPRVFVDRLVPRYLLTPAAKVPPLLRFYDTWDAMKGKRDELLKGAADKLLAQIARGITT